MRDDCNADAEAKDDNTTLKQGHAQVRDALQQGLDLIVSPLVSQEQQKVTKRVAAKAKQKA